MISFCSTAVLAQPVDGEPKKSSETLEDILKKQSNETLEEIQKKAAIERLITEREEVAEELENADGYDECEVEKAVEMLLEGKNDNLTQASNIKAICKAYAMVDANFSALYGQLQKAKSPKELIKLAAKIKPQLKSLAEEQEKTYANTVYYWLYAQCLEKYFSGQKAGKYKTNLPWKLMESYRDILYDLRSKISFASESALRCAEILEKMNRMFYALEMYKFVLENYTLTMNPEQKKLAQMRFDQLDSIYKNPMDSLSGMMTGVKKRFDSAKVDESTQRDAEDIVLLLEDIIKTMEEKQRAKKKKQQKNQNQKQKQKQKGHKKGNKKGNKQGKTSKGQKSGSKKPGSKQGGTPKKATKPAKKPFLPTGAFKAPDELKSQDDNTSGGAWAKLPPNKREAAKKDLKKRGAKYRDQARDFNRRLSSSDE